MAKSKKKAVEVQKFGGTEDLGTTKMHGYDHDVQSIETQSKTHLEDDVGYGDALVIRCFKFGMNPVAFKEYSPTKQELFNSHYKGIEVALWRDGLMVMPDVNPRIVVDETSGQYEIFVGARPAKGHILNATPKTLSDLAHG